MKYRLEYYPNANMVCIHTDQRVSTKHKSYGSTILSDMDLEESLKKGPSMIRSLLRVRGVICIRLNDFEIQIEKGTVFRWEDILGKILVIANVELDPKGKLEEAAPPKKPSQVYLRSLERQGSDLDPLWIDECPFDDD